MSKLEQHSACPRCSSWKTLALSMEAMLRDTRERLAELESGYREARNTLESEREANRLLTEEVEELKGVRKKMSKTTLRELEEMIAAFSDLVADFPNSNEYKETLAKLQQQRAEVVAKIGRKNTKSS